MSTAWTLAATDICTDALQHMGVIGAGEAASGDDIQTALRALDGVLKELPVKGYTWPKLSGEVALTWGGAGVQTVVLPDDYYNYPVAWKLVDGKRYPLTQIVHADWVRMPDRSAAGSVTHFYISPAKVLYLYPTPATVNPVVTLQYQKIVDDADLALPPDVLQIWMNPLGYGVANELALKYSLPQDRRVEIAQRWQGKRDSAMESSLSYEPISVGVAD